MNRVHVNEIMFVCRSLVYWILAWMFIYIDSNGLFSGQVFNKHLSLALIAVANKGHPAGWSNMLMSTAAFTKVGPQFTKFIYYLLAITSTQCS